MLFPYEVEVAARNSLNFDCDFCFKVKGFIDMISQAIGTVHRY